MKKIFPLFFVLVSLFSFSNASANTIIDKKIDLSLEKPVCSTPTWPMATSVTCNSALISWDGVNGAVSYQLEYRAIGNPSWTTINASSVYYSLSGLSANTAYEWRIRTYCGGADYSAYTYSQTFTTSCTTYCQIPTGTYETGISSTGATLNWAPAAGAQSYTVEYQVWGSGTWITASTTTNNSVTLIGLTSNTMYEWRVRANCNYGWYSLWSSLDSFQTTAAYYPCSSPTSLSNLYTSSTTNTISWSAVSGAISYQVQYRQYLGTWTTVTVNTNSLTLTGLVCSANYEFCVRALYSSGNYSNWSYAYSFQQNCITYCGSPSGLFATLSGTSNAVVSWNAAYGASYYEIQYKATTSSTWQYATVYGTNFTIYGLSPCVTYHFCVRANCGSGNWSSWSYAHNFTTSCLSCDAPTYLTETNIGSNTATLSWGSGGSGVLSYTLQYRQVGSSYWTTINNIYGTSTTLNTLSPNTNYEYAVRSNCLSGLYSGWSGIQDFWTSPASCGIPYGINAYSITSNSASISWQSVSGAVDYTLQYRVGNYGAWNTITVTNPAAFLSGLSPATTYQLCIRANCAYGNYGLWSSIYSFTTLSPFTCYAPNNLGTSSVGSTSATLTWNAIPGASSYEVQYRAGNSGTWTTLVVTSNSLTLTNLTSCSTYHFCVRTLCNPYGTSTWSYNYSFNTYCPPAVCTTAPTGLSVSNIGANSAVLNWTAVSGANYYEIQYRLNNGQWVVVNSNTNSLSLAGLTGCSTYHFCVRAVCSSGIYSTWSYNYSFNTYCPPAVCTTAPTGLSVSNIGANSAVLNWTAVSGANYYEIQYRLNNGQWVVVNSNTNSLSLTGLTGCSTYHFCVRAVCSSGIYSTWSYNYSFNTYCPPAVCTTAPTGLSVGNIGANSAVLNWTAVSGANYYEIQYQLNNGQWVVVNAYSNSITLTGLTECGTYHFCVRGVCSSGIYSAWSYNYSFNTTCVPHYCTTAPTGLGVSNVGLTSSTLNWTAVAGATAYEVQYRQANTSNWISVVTTTNSINLTSLSGCANYQYCVRAICGYGTYSPWSNAYSWATTCPPPSCTWAPTNLSSYNNTNSVINVQWQAVTGAISYQIQYRIGTSGTWLYANANTNAIALSGLTSCSNYYICVRAICYAGSYSPWSNVYVSSTTCPPPACNVAPSGISSYNVNSNNTNLNWSAVSGAVSYEIQYRPASSSSWIFTNSTTNNISLSGLNPCTTYHFCVRAVCSYGSSAWSYNYSFTTNCDPHYVCDAPTNLSEWDIWNNSVKLMWTGVTNAGSYTIQYRILGTSTWSSITNSGLGNMQDIFGLASGTTYEWRIASACNTGGSSQFSSIRTFTTTGGTPATGSNDNACGAFNLPVDFTCINTLGSTIGSTGSSYPAAPTSCYYSPNDVWFKAVFPPNGALSIRTASGSLQDGVMALYRGSDCNNLTYFMCIDDSYGTTMPTVDVAGVPGSTLWIRIWGYGNSNGTFNICATTSSYLITNTPNVSLKDDLEVSSNTTESSNFILNQSKVKKNVEMFVYPNPANQYLKVEFGKQFNGKNVSFKIFDLSGRELLNGMESELFGPLSVNTSELMPGLYLLECKIGEESLRTKISIAR
ncbi:MAG: fibronectin type III domain-containing protein [Saprospiraceae bacterium]|nr:fibronectin type III domain-containing protein [Saprospiraceae bacterium]